MKKIYGKCSSRIYSRCLSSFFLSIIILTVYASAQEKLVLIGGGKRPAEAISRFVNWSGKEKARILIVTWASGVPQESFDGIKKDFSAYQIASFENAPFAPLTEKMRREFLAQLKNASGIFFTGGDQNRIMDVLADEELYAALRERYGAGVVFGGTSAGTAAMSTPMMTGEANLKIIDGAKVGTRQGLGLLPNIVLDQHFIVRQRENRLFGLILQNPTLLGIGIDEDMAVLVEDNRRAEVVGETQVMFIDAHNRKGAMLIHLLKAGERFDLKKRKMISRAKAVTQK
ncbi:MAG: cyanophycinase [Acidobacteria bacterium]|jgi:cyanophycinase|nr:cyanophycinase [Acidobacteriota bacterium]MBA3783975.1 cyanophycinase [Acidobacteriota bacterium]MBA4182669.1 cyanophycinase [Acidobacteriota bacterium]